MIFAAPIRDLAVEIQQRKEIPVSRFSSNF